MHVTVMVPTYRRPAGLARLLDHLARQRHPGVEWDVLVVDNDDGSARNAFEAASRTLPVGARFVVEAHRGSAHARNRGIAEARGDVIAMLDDDVRPARDWLLALLEPIIAGRCDGTGGRVVLDPAVPRPRWFDLEAIGGYLAHWDPAAEERDLGSGETIVTSNCAFRTDLVRRAGGFDAGLGPRGGVPLVNDDTLLTRKLAAAGARLRFVPAAVVNHDLPPERLKPAYLLKRAYAHGRSDWILDRDRMDAGRAKGAGAAFRNLGTALRRRLGEGLGRPEVAFHAACDLARAAGNLREAALLALRSGRGGDPAS